MTNEKMTIHEALSELKTLDKRIHKAISVSFIGTKKNSQDQVGTLKIADFTQNTKAAFDKANDLIERRNAIKQAVVLSNARTEVDIVGTIYTVAEAIEMKNHGMEFWGLLRDCLLNNFNTAKTTADRANSTLQSSAENFVTNTMGNRDSKVNTSEYDDAVRKYVESNTTVLVDPLSIQKHIDEITDKVDSFMTKVDSALSVSNALTVIEISY